MKEKNPLLARLQPPVRRALKAQNALFQRHFEKGETVFHAGDITQDIGIVLSGRVMIENTDVRGRSTILSHIEVGQAFAESYALCGVPMMVDAVCAQETEILFLRVSAALRQENQHADWYLPLTQALLRMAAGKNLALSERIFCTSPKAVRARILTYLSAQATRRGALSFSVPFNRQQMADYLNVDRSALSRELCRMRDEGLLTFNKNQFTLLK